MEDKVKFVIFDVEVKDVDVIINVGNEGENGVVELNVVWINKGRVVV